METVTFCVTQVWQTVLLPGIEVAEKTVFASRNVSALLRFAPHHVGNGLARSVCNGLVGTEIYSRRGEH